jgi:hypothetical protein
MRSPAQGCGRALLRTDRPKVEADEMPREAAAVPIGDEHTTEAGGVEHRGKADKARADLHASSLGIDRVGLDTRCACRPCRGHDPLQQGCCDAAAPKARPDSEAADHPHGKVIYGWNRSRVCQAWQRGAHAYPNPADRDTVEVGEETRGHWPIGNLLAQKLLARSATRERLRVETAPRLAPAAHLAVDAEELLDIRPSVSRGRNDLEIAHRGILRDSPPQGDGRHQKTPDSASATPRMASIRLGALENRPSISRPTRSPLTLASRGTSANGGTPITVR